MASLCNTKHSLDTFWFLLQVCRDLLEAAESGDVDTVKKLFQCTNDSCTTDDQNRTTPLIYAARNGHVEVVRVLLKGGANAERANANQQTALHNAAGAGYVEVCRLLLDWGAKVDPLDEGKNTPLHDAAQMRQLCVIKLLVERGANIWLMNNKFQNPYGIVLSQAHLYVTEWSNLVSRG
jgi:ankyrin repeat protein